MDVLSLIIYLAVVGVLAWLATYLLQQFPPPEPLAKLLRVAIIVVAVIAVVVLILRAFGLALPLL